MNNWCNNGTVHAGFFPRSLYENLSCGVDPGTKKLQVQFTSIQDLPTVLANVVEILLTVIAVLAVIFIIVAGIRYITSEGDANRVSTAKAGLTNAIIGLALSAGAYIIVDFLASRLVATHP